MSNSFARWFRSTVCLLLALMLAVPANAVTLVWNNAAGGFAGTASNWLPALAPTAADSLVFPLAGTYPVTFGTLIDTTYAATLTDGDVTFRYPAPHLMTGRLDISGVDPHLVQDGGQFESRGMMQVGYGTGNRGWYQVRGAGTRATFSNVALHLVGGLLTASGTLDVEHGADVEYAGALLVGNGGGQGEVRVLGESAAPGSVSSRLRVGTVAGVPTIGQAGTGSVQVRDGARLEAGGPLRVGALITGVGTLVVGGLGALDSARVVVPTTLGVGVNSTAPAITRGTVRVQSGGVVEVGGVTTVGEAATAGDDTLAIEPGGRFVTHGLTFADAATGLQFTGGLLQVVGGTLSMGDDALRVEGASAGQTLELLAGADAVLDPLTAPGLLVGGSGPAVMRVRDGSTVTLLHQNLRVADDATAIGDLSIANGSSLTVAENVIVARDGIGTVSVDNGSTATMADLRAGTGAAGVGAFVVRGASSQAHVSQQLELGGTATAASGGIGVAGVESSGTLWLNHTTDAGDIWPNSTLQVKSGGTVRMAGALEVRGRVLMEGGVTDGGTLRPLAGGHVEGAGDVASRLGSLGDTTGRVLPTGALLLGRADAVNGVDFDGRIETGIHTVTLRDADSSRVAGVTLAGGSLVLPAGGGTSVAGRTWTGEGTIVGRFRPAGLVVPSGPNGLQFTGLLQGVGQGVNGSRLRFAPGGGFAGSGALQASIQSDSGSTITSTGNLTLGARPLASTVRVDGLLQSGAHTITFAATDSIRLGGTWAMSGTSATSQGAQPVRVLPTGAISGRGSLAGALLTLDGTLDPGPDAGRLQFAGLTMRAGSRYRAGLGAFAAGRHDTVVVGGTVVVAGQLDLARLPDFVATPGDSFQVISASSVSGAFSAVTVDGVSTSGQVAIVYRPGGVWVRLLPGIVDAPAAPPSHARALRLTAEGSPGPSPSLRLELPVAAAVTVALFDVAGRRLATVHEGPLPAGVHRLRMPHGTGAPGLSFARAVTVAGRHTEARTVRVLRLE